MRNSQYDIVKAFQRGDMSLMMEPNTVLDQYFGSRLRNLYHVAEYLRDNNSNLYAMRNSIQVKKLFIRLTAFVSFMDWYLKQERLDVSEVAEHLAEALLADIASVDPQHFR